MALAGCPNLTLWGTQANGTYQNGAYWATPLSYMASALLQNGHGAFLESLLGAAVADFKAHGIYEDVDYGLPATAHGVLNYTASATNALLAASRTPRAASRNSTGNTAANRTMPPVQTARINIHDALDTEPNAPNFRWKN